ncbi:hypothetical protein M758_5G016100 [Ceratodon purpureus]|nr:hypothetical protein M758_5G016100 [Ceratodon purpureus]
MDDSAFDEFLQTPILGRRKSTKTKEEEEEEEDVEQGKLINNAAAVQVPVVPHQAVSRKGEGASTTTSLREANYGGGRSQLLHPQLEWGYCLLQGLEGRDMEDLHVAQVRTINDQEVAFFGVFDSHKGDAAARYLQEHLFDAIVSELEGGGWSDPAGATRDAYLATDGHILDAVDKGGSTAVTAMVCDNGGRVVVVVANVGDSRAVMSKAGKAVQLSVDHDPGRPTERASVEARGGHVTHLPGDQWRVDGQLALARVFGDKALKEHMSAKPDVVEVTVDLGCEFLVLGSNGLFSLFDNQEVVDRVRASNGDPVTAAHELVLEARRRYGEDDISCIVIMFREM